MSTDAMYTGCIDETLKHLANHTRYVYMYVFEHKGVNTMSEFASSQPKYGMTCSADELFYLFMIRKARTMPFTDLKVSTRMITLWTDFAKHGYVIDILVVVKIAKPEVVEIQLHSLPTFNHNSLCINLFIIICLIDTHRLNLIPNILLGRSLALTIAIYA